MILWRPGGQLWGAECVRAVQYGRKCLGMDRGLVAVYVKIDDFCIKMMDFVAKE